jgi:FKBP-type peptidyl-prolyl cis-trans isomerase FklB
MKRLGLALAIVMGLAGTHAFAADASLSRAANAAFLAENAKKPGVVVRPSGLQYKVLRTGFGKRPAATDLVSVYYTGRLINGTVFDGTEPGLPAGFAANGVIRGWTEALTLMREGDQWQLVIPSNLAYGNAGHGSAIPPDQTLVFEVELVSVTTPKAPPPGKDDDQ